MKPLLEKRRRARINESLKQLKGLILPLLGREVRAEALGAGQGGPGTRREVGGRAEAPPPQGPARGLRARRPRQNPDGVWPGAADPPRTVARRAPSSWQDRGAQAACRR